MTIKAVSNLTDATGAAVILKPGSHVIEGRFRKDAETGNIDVQFDSIPDGPLVLIIQDEHDSRHSGTFEGNQFIPGA